jgi:hypothetical protein
LMPRTNIHCCSHTIVQTPTVRLNGDIRPRHILHGAFLNVATVDIHACWVGCATRPAPWQTRPTECFADQLASARIAITSAPWQMRPEAHRCTNKQLPWAADTEEHR